MTEQSLSCVVVDAGARYGLHPSWQELQDIADFHLFDIDPVEIERLRQKYSAQHNITVYETALNNESGPLTFSLRAHKGLTSIYTPDSNVISDFDYMQEEQTVTGKIEVMAQTIDDLFRGQEVHFLKLDTEGAELLILQGAANTLTEHVLAVRCEVSFVPMLEGAPLFHDIDTFLRAHGFELLNIDYTGRGHPASEFTLPNRYGKLVATDGVWIATDNRLFQGDPGDVAKRALLMASFLMLNNASDVAIDILLRAATRPYTDLGPFEHHPLFRFLRRKVLLLFKDMSYLPYARMAEIRESYRIIFNSEFPRMSMFFESDLLS